MEFELFIRSSLSKLIELQITNDLKDADMIEIIFTPITNFIEFNVFMATNKKFVNTKNSDQIGT